MEIFRIKKKNTFDFAQIYIFFLSGHLIFLCWDNQTIDDLQTKY